jgi:hypothetical protein
MNSGSLCRSRWTSLPSGSGMRTGGPTRRYERVQLQHHLRDVCASLANSGLDRRGAHAAAKPYARHAQHPPERARTHTCPQARKRTLKSGHACTQARPRSFAPNHRPRLHACCVRGRRRTLARGTSHSHVREQLETRSMRTAFNTGSRCVRWRAKTLARAARSSKAMRSGTRRTVSRPPPPPFRPPALRRAAPFVQQWFAGDGVPRVAGPVPSCNKLHASMERATCSEQRRQRAIGRGGVRSLARSLDRRGAVHAHAAPARQPHAALARQACARLGDGAWCPPVAMPAGACCPSRVVCLRVVR